MSTSLVPAVGMPLGNELVAKAQAFKEIGALCTAGFFPQGVNNVQQVMAICWMADAIGVHPMVALQECYVVKGKVGFSWRMKWAKVLQMLPEAEYAVVKQDETACVLKGRRSKTHEWIEVAFTADQALRQGFTKPGARNFNELYVSDWEDMSFKACMHRLIDRMAADVVRGLPTPEIASESALDAAPAAPEKEPSAAEVIEDAAVAAGVAPTPVRDFVAELGQFIDTLYGKKQPKEKKLFVVNESLKQMRGPEAGVYKKADQILATDAAEVLEWLKARYPNGKLSAESDLPPAAPQPESALPQPTSTPARRRTIPMCDYPNCKQEAVTAGPEGTWCIEHVPVSQVEVEVPLEDDAPAASTTEADGARAAEDIDGKIEMLRAVIERGKKVFNHRMEVEAPAGSGNFYMMYAPIQAAFGFKSGTKLYEKHGDQVTQVVDPDLCRRYVRWLREEIGKAEARR